MILKNIIERRIIFPSKTMKVQKSQYLLYLTHICHQTRVNNEKILIQYCLKPIEFRIYLRIWKESTILSLLLLLFSLLELQLISYPHKISNLHQEITSSSILISVLPKSVPNILSFSTEKRTIGEQKENTFNTSIYVSLDKIFKCVQFFMEQPAVGNFQTVTLILPTSSTIKVLALREYKSISLGLIGSRRFHICWRVLVYQSTGMERWSTLSMIVIVHCILRLIM